MVVLRQVNFLVTHDIVSPDYVKMNFLVTQGNTKSKSGVYTLLAHPLASKLIQLSLPSEVTPMAQMAKRMSSKHEVTSSSLRGGTFFAFCRSCVFKITGENAALFLVTQVNKSSLV